MPTSGFPASFPSHEAHTVEWASLKGKKNGELLQAAERGGDHVLLKVDQGIPRQQMEDLLPVAAAIINSVL